MERIQSQKRMLRWALAAVVACALSAAPSFAFIFGEPLPPLPPPLPPPLSGGPPSVPPGPPTTTPTDGGVQPPATEPGGPTIPPPVVGSGPPDSSQDTPPDDGVRAPDPPPITPQSVSSAPEPATLIAGLVGAGLIGAYGAFKRKLGLA
jgi:hypothetical protein